MRPTWWDGKKRRACERQVRGAVVEMADVVEMCLVIG